MHLYYMHIYFYVPWLIIILYILQINIQCKYKMAVTGIPEDLKCRFFLEILDFHDICDYGMVNLDFRRFFHLH